MRFGWVSVDAGYGKEPAFLRALDDMKEVFAADIHRTQRVWTAPPGLHVPEPKTGRGRPAKKPHVSAEPVAVQRLVEGFASGDCTRCGRATVRVARCRSISPGQVWVWDGEEPSARCWHLIVRREVGSPKTIKYTLCNAPADTPRAIWF